MYKTDLILTNGKGSNAIHLLKPTTAEQGFSFAAAVSLVFENRNYWFDILYKRIEELRSFVFRTINPSIHAKKSLPVHRRERQESGKKAKFHNDEERHRYFFRDWNSQ